MEELSKVIVRFEGFIKRKLIPSASFWMMFILFDIYYHQKILLSFLEKEHHILMIILVLIIFVGVSVLLNLLQQLLFDNYLKKNFNALSVRGEEDTILIDLRNKVILDLAIDKDTNDYSLYQIIGAKLKNIKKEINTTKYVDDAKMIGIFFISLIFMFILCLYFEGNSEFSVLSTILIFIMGKYAVSQRYRARAIRIYTNYLIIT